MVGLLGSGEPIGDSGLTWYSVGVGYYPVTAGIAPYDQAYFDRYARQAETPIGRALMDSRVAFVARHYAGPLIDVGIGSGAFVRRRLQLGQATYGWDVNQAGLDWLRGRGLQLDPYRSAPAAVSLFDVIEHMLDFVALIDRVSTWLFISTPIFRGAAHALGSKHFRPLEHCWYFSRAGLVRIMRAIGFELIEENTKETAIGREDIGSFAFKRKETCKT
jgi:hypothetical protein